MSRVSQAEWRARAARKSTARRRRALVWWGLAAVIVAGAGVVWWTAAARTQTQALVIGQQMVGQPVPDEGFDHVPVGTEVHYRANPPASGPHYPAPAPAGVYPGGLAPGFWVHSLEHGYIVVVYKPPVSPEAMTQFESMVKEFPKSKYGNVKLVIAPYDIMIRPFAVLAWDWRMWMNTFDRAKVLEFYRAHVDHGREDLP